jgi:hypothetical protein
MARWGWFWGVSGGIGKILNFFFQNYTNYQIIRRENSCLFGEINKKDKIIFKISK